MYTWDEKVALTRQMMRDRAPVLKKMQDVLTKYEGDTVLLMPELPDEPTMPQITPMLVAEAVDKTAQRAASISPMVVCPSIDPTKKTGKRSREYASIRRHALHATYRCSKWELAIRRAFRQLSAYYTTSILVTPDFRYQRPKIGVRDPLSTFAETVAENDMRPPMYVAFVSRHSGASVRQRWAQARTENGGPVPPNRTDLLWDVVEWVDEDETVFGLLGPSYESEALSMLSHNNAPSMQLSPSYPNRIEMLPAVVPANITLSRVSSRLSNVLGMLGWMEKIATLDMIAQEKAIFPDMYVLGAQGVSPRLVNGRWIDGREGEINMIEGAQAIGVLHSTPDQRSTQITDRIERNFRVSSGTLPQYGGESFSALRTGRALDAMMAASVDPMIQELHELMSAWLPDMNRAILATYKAYWGSKSYSMHSGRLGDNQIVAFTPDTHFETFDNVVQYPVPGADMIQTTQVLGSLHGANLISQATARQLHPLIPDPEQESRMVALEQVDAAVSEAIRMQIVGGQLPLSVMTQIRRSLADGEDWATTLEDVDRRLRELQAQQAPAPAPGQMMAPESAPGLAGGPGAAQAPAPTPEVNVPQGAERMRQLMAAMGAG